MILFIFQPHLLLSMPSATEWIIILVVVLLLFGGKKLPELMRGIGKGVNEFKKAKEGEDETDEKKEDKPKA
jgi:sec-independent protein translocase protein TatA